MNYDEEFEPEPWMLDLMADSAHSYFSAPVEPHADELALLSGALGGFDSEQAARILTDPSKVAFLNARWAEYEEINGYGALPLNLQKRLDRERIVGGDQPNLRVVHAAGYGWSDEDLREAALELTLSAQPYREGALSGFAARGEASEDVLEEDLWQIILRSQHLVILARLDADQLIVEVRSDSHSGSFQMQLHWPDRTAKTTFELRAGLPTRLSMRSDELPWGITLRPTSV